MKRVVFVLDTPNVWRGRALAGTPARVLALTEHLSAVGVAATLMLCDRGADYGPAEDWAMDAVLVHPAVFYDPHRLAIELRRLSCSTLVSCEAEFVLSTAHAAAMVAGSQLVYDAHDDDATVAASLGEAESVVARHRLVQRAALRAADSVVVSTLGEQHLARSAGIAERRIALVPNGADRPADRGPRPGSRLLAFVGNLYYEPNARAVGLIRERILPPLRGTSAEFQVRVVGQGPRALRRTEPGLEFTGRVPSLDEALAGAALGLAPLTAGSGAKMKILDYLAAGIPVVGTSEAVTGLPAEHPGVIVCDDIDAYPAFITGLLSDANRMRELALAGRRCVERDLSWPVIARRLAQHLERITPQCTSSCADGSLMPAGTPRWQAEHERHGVLGAPCRTRPDQAIWLRRRTPR